MPTHTRENKHHRRHKPSSRRLIQQSQRFDVVELRKGSEIRNIELRTMADYGSLSYLLRNGWEEVQD